MNKKRLYADFLAKELKPYIDERYRTKTDFKQTAVGGSSMGAYISLYTAVKYPDQFSKVSALSGSFENIVAKRIS